MTALSTQTPLEELVLRLLGAALCATVIGFEREAHNRPAGLRTHILVALGSAAFMILALELALARIEYGQDVRMDPTRIIEGIVGGIGFLGAGTIIQSRGSVKGLTTGASIWTVGSVGIACGAGLYAIAIAVTVIALVVLVGLGVIERRTTKAPDRAKTEQ